jgi:cell division septation protein DedD
VNHLQHREDSEDRDDVRSGAEREIHLGTTLILGIFFALAVLCAVFFGLGYSIGHKSVVPAAVAPGVGAQTGPNFSGFKPAAGSLLSQASDKPMPAAGPSVTLPLTTPTPDGPGKPGRVALAENPADGAVVGDPLPASPRAAAVPVATTTPVPPVVAGGSALVQVAAVSHQEDADLLVTTLKRRGYAVAIRNEPQDKLLHVQVGPFANHKDADVMRQKLLADGFNAIVKDVK